MTSQIKTTELPIAFDADFDSSDFVLILDDGVTKRLPRQDMIDNFLPLMQGEKGDTGATGIKGDKGDKGDKGSTGATGAQGIQGIQGIAGATGAQGQKGWSPILAVVSDGARRVLQVSDWTGGAGTKPASGSYIGATGLTAIVGDAVDFRGIQGIQGLTGVAGIAGTNGTNGVDGDDAKQITAITHEANNAIKATFTDATFVTSDAPKKLTGWASYTDSIYTVGSPLSIANGVTATVNNNAATVINTYIPFGVTSFWNSATAKITPTNAGDGYTFCLRCKIKPSSADTYLDFGIDVGGAVGVIFKQTLVLPKGAGIEHDINIECTGYSLATFVSNGGIMKITANAGTLSIYNIELQVHRYYAA